MQSKLIDLRREHPSQYAGRAEPEILDVGRTWALTLTGRGSPEGDDFDDASGVLTGLVNRLKRASRRARRDFKVAPLECMYWSARKGSDLESAPAESWHWRLLYRVPRFLQAADLAAARAELEDRRDAARARIARLEWVDENWCIQALHIGSLADAGRTIARMRSVAEARGLALRLPRHDVFLTDPRRTPPDEMKALIRLPIVRMPAARARALAGP